MKRVRYTIGVLIVGAAILGGALSRPSVVAQGKAPAAAQAWEYHVYSGSPLPSEFDKLAQGWELSLIIPGENYHRHTYVFKRPKQ